MAAIPSFARAAALTSVLISTVYGALPEALLFQRQDVNDTVGTNLYNCHDNCGEAILEEEVAGFCNSSIFSTDYASCLQCAGPDNEDIWQFYGPYLTACAIECGSATVPLSGTQADVATALLAQNVSSTASDASTSTTLASASATTTASSASAAAPSASHTSTASGASVQSKPFASSFVGYFSALVVIAVISLA